MPDQPKTLTLAGLVSYLGIPRSTFYRMIEDGRFPVEPIKGTNPRRWDVDKVDQWRGS